MEKKILIFFLVIFLVVVILFFVRLLSLKEIDDVHPEFFCSEDLLKKSDILWIVPKFENKLISEDKEWCDYILSLNKTLGLHGVYHSFNEFGKNRDQEYLKEGIDVFEECFGFRPLLFKPPQLKISRENKKLIKNNGLELKGKINQFFHKVYHCNDSGLFSNKFIDFF